MVNLQRLSRGEVLDRPEGQYLSTGLSVADTNRVPRDQLQGLAQNMGVPIPAQLATVAGYSNTFFRVIGPLIAAGGSPPPAAVIPSTPQPRQPGWAAPLRLAQPDQFRTIAQTAGTPGLIALFDEAISARPDLAHLTWADVGETWALYSSSGDSADQAQGFGSGRLMWVVPLGPSPTPAEIQPEIPAAVLEFVALPEEPPQFQIGDDVVYRDLRVDNRQWRIVAVRVQGDRIPYWVADIASLSGDGAERRGIEFDDLQRAGIPQVIPEPDVVVPAEPSEPSPFRVNDVVAFRNQSIDDRDWLVTAVRSIGFLQPFWAVNITALSGGDDRRQDINVAFLVHKIPGFEPFQPTIGDLSEIAGAVNAVPVAVAREVSAIISAETTLITAAIGTLGGLISAIEIPDLLTTFPGLVDLGDFLTNPLDYIFARGGEITISPDIGDRE